MRVCVALAVLGIYMLVGYRLAMTRANNAIRRATDLVVVWQEHGVLSDDGALVAQVFQEEVLKVTLTKRQFKARAAGQLDI